jgi:hypothetical protein
LSLASADIHRIPGGFELRVALFAGSSNGKSADKTQMPVGRQKLDDNPRIIRAPR